MEERRLDGEAVACIAPRLCDAEDWRPSRERHHVCGGDEHPVADLVDKAGHREEGARAHWCGHEVVDRERLQRRQPRRRRRWRPRYPRMERPPRTSGHSLTAKWRVRSPRYARAARTGRPCSRSSSCLVLTACRSGDVRGATWDEIDLENEVWAIPGERMKVHRAHRVPLSSGARAILIQSKELTDRSNLVFPSVTGRPLVGLHHQQARSREWNYRGAARIPLIVPGLVRRVFRGATRGSRSGACTCGGWRRRGVCALGPVRATAHADAGMERLSRILAEERVGTREWRASSQD